MTEKPNKSRSKVMGGSIGAGAGVIAIFVLVFAPIVSVSYQEPYKVMETRQESYVDIERRTEAYTDIQTNREAYTDIQTNREAYTDVESNQEAYNVIETQNEDILTFTDTTMAGGEWLVQTVYVSRDMDAELQMRASDTLTTYVTSRSDFQANNNQYNNPVSQQASVRYGFTAPISDTYYIAFYNPHGGFFGIGDKNVGLYSATVTATWDETVTKHRMVDVPVTKYRDVDTPVIKYRNVDTPVTMYRDVDVPVTKYKDVQVEVTKEREATKNITLLDSIMGKK